MSLNRVVPMLAVLLGLSIAVPVARAQTAAADEFPVNVLGSQNEVDSAVARNASGRTVIVWDDNGTIRARRFDAAGAPLDNGFVVDAAGMRPDVAIAADGGFIVTWIQAGADANARFRRYGADGLATGPASPVLVGTPALNATQTAIALDDHGRFAIATAHADPARGISTGPILLWLVGAGIVDLLAAPMQVNVSHFDVDGRALNSATLSRASDLTFYLAVQSVVGGGIEGVTPQFGGNVDVALDAFGNATVVWDSISGFGVTPLVVLGSTLGRVAGTVQVRRLRRGASQLGPEVTVDVGQSVVLQSFNPGTIAFAPPPPKPSIALRNDGRAVLAYALPFRFEIVPRPLDVGDTREIDRSLRLTTLSPTLLPQRLPTVVAEQVEAASIAVDASGNAVVAWEGPLPGPIMAQRFDAALAPLAAPVAVGSRQRTTFAPTTSPIGLGAAADGSFALSWQQRVTSPGPRRTTVRARFYTVP